jgi:hypothetical protein
LCWLRWKNFSCQHWLFFFCLFTLCSAHVSGLMIVLNENPCERVGKLETLSDFERGQIVGACLARASMKKLPHYQVYRERQFLKLCRHTRSMGRQHQWRGTVGQNFYCQKEIIIHWEGLFQKTTELLRHRWQQNGLFILKTLFPQKLWASRIQHPL